MNISTLNDLTWNYFFQVNQLAVSKPTFSSNPFISSLFSAPETHESHITKIPPRSEKQQQTEPPSTDPPQSFVEQKLSHVLDKLFTLSQLANTLRGSANPEENPDGFTIDDQTNPPPPFFEQKVGRIVDKLFRLSQFATAIRERFNQPNHVFEYENITPSEEEDGDSSFETRFKASKPEKSEESFEEVEQNVTNSVKDVNVTKEGDLKNETNNEVETKETKQINVAISKMYLPIKEADFLKEEHRGQKNDMNEPSILIEDSTVRICPNESTIINKTLPDPVKDIEVFSATEIVFETTTLSDENVTRTKAEDNEISKSKILLKFSSLENSTEVDNSTNVSTEAEISTTTTEKVEPSSDSGRPSLKEMAEQVGYFVLELFASIVGLSLGAASQINHALHQSNNTVLQGIYNATHQVTST